MLTDLLIKALRPIIVPLLLEAVGGSMTSPKPAPRPRPNPMPSSPPPGFAIYER